MPNHERRKSGADDDFGLDLWRQFTAGITPLRPAVSPLAEDASPAPPSRSPLPQPRTDRSRRQPDEVGSLRPPPQLVPQPAPHPPLAAGIAAGIDQRTLVRLKRGLIRPETQIDLHRMTQAEAHGALIGFLASAQRAGRRCALVITGKGFGSAGAIGVLKSNVPRWLNEPPSRERVLAFAFAINRDGGEGAIYVLLRRLRAEEASSPERSRSRR